MAQNTTISYKENIDGQSSQETINKMKTLAKDAGCGLGEYIIKSFRELDLMKLREFQEKDPKGTEIR